MKKKLASVLLCAVMAASMLTGCGNADNATATTPATDNKTDAAATTEAAEKTAEKTAEAAGSVYYLNFKPEVDEVWQKLAQEYTEETGVPVKVVTAASGTYEQTLMSEIANKEAPTLFQINGPIGYQNWKDYCADLKDTDLYSWLMDKSLAITGEDGGVYGIPYVVEGYGIIYNDAIMQKYFALDGAKAASMDEINNFAKLKEVVEDMQAKKDELGEITYHEEDLQDPILCPNIASGLKNILTIQKLLDNGYLNSNSLLLIDEPEVNLHPEWQVKFAEILVLLYKELGIRIILNTHSPYFMRAIETKLAEQELADMGRYYFMKEVSPRRFVAEDVTGKTEIVYRTMYKPLEGL